MSTFNVTRAHLKTACDEKNWDLLDKLLEIDASKINDNALYTDTWGEWWGMLIEAVKENSVEGVSVLLKHGAQPDVASWGDGIPHTAIEIAEDKPEILALLQASEPVEYLRQTDPPLPQGESEEASAINRQGEIREATGLVFQTDAWKQSD
ncbi:MAG: hypothetical protein HY231_12440 [Acidobacteria bacterium]|nr:hypothetical protein [Acidobacteriota bacterium]